MLIMIAAQSAPFNYPLKFDKIVRVRLRVRVRVRVRVRWLQFALQ